MSEDSGIARSRTAEDLIDQAHFICPRCRRPDRQAQLQLDVILHKESDFVLEGFLRCPESACASRYPIVQGVPVILKNIAPWWRASRLHLTSAATESAELAGFFQKLDQDDAAIRGQHRLLSTYMDAHYVREDSVFWSIVKGLIENRPPGGRTLDLGCSVGRFTFELARDSDLAIGLDTNFCSLAAAAKIQRDQAVAFANRLRGSVFQDVSFPIQAPRNALFVVADAMDPPFLAESFDLVAGLNILDNVEVPLILLGQMDALLRAAGLLIISSPYEWREDIADPVEWLENDEMDAATMVRCILSNEIFPAMQLDYRIIEEHAAVPWNLHQQQRYQSLYSTHILKAQKG